MVKWKLKLNFLQRMHPLCVCWLCWRMSTQSLWRLQVRWTEIFFSPSPSLLLPFCLNPPVLRSARGIRVKVAMQKNWSPENLELAFSPVILLMGNWERLLLVGSVFPSAAVGLQGGNTLLGVLRTDCSLWSTLSLAVRYDHHHISIGRAPRQKVSASK